MIADPRFGFADEPTTAENGIKRSSRRPLQHEILLCRRNHFYSRQTYEIVESLLRGTNEVSLNHQVTLLDIY